ncbi:hydroxylysine kinase [Asbolus verrucosus]|uniref:Hydroxylysine kinase n=1 Tax=Asbolus verrucosus TaxID=1661398 RepID=A0A482VW50_ASBVE|nr:hydroxylysine kinase [Asbolus verrucosus]
MAENNTILQPGASIKPKVSEDDVKEILSEVYGLKCMSIKELNGYDDNNYYVKVDETCNNNYIDRVNEDGYTLKVINSLESTNPQFFEAQDELLIHLDKKGVRCPKPVQNKNGRYYIIKDFSSGRHLVRLLEFITGSILHQVPSSMDLFYQVGQYVAKLDEALKDFHHPAYDTHKSLWMMESVPQLTQFLFAITDDSRKKLVESVIAEFSKKISPLWPQFEKRMIHGDFNEQNILVDQKDGKWFIKAILDFGDSHLACCLFELAITMAYMMIEGKSMDAGGYVLAGYTSIRKLSSQECNLLKVCIAGRLCQSLVIGAYSILQDPGNSYILTTAKAGWNLLEDLWAQPEEELLKHWTSFQDPTQ